MSEVITPEEKAEFEAYCQSQEADQVRAMFCAVLEDCGREIDLLASYVKNDHLGKSPDVTPSDVADANAVYEKLVNINAALGLFDDYAPA